jgi:hypothetical protein
VFPSRFHLPTPLGSTVITRFIATMGALTPALLLPAPEQVSLIHTHALRDIPSPTTPCASVPAMLLAPGGLGLRVAFGASGGSSDFVHCSQSRQSHISRIEFVSRVLAHCSTDYPFTSSCSPPHVAMDAVTFSYWREAPPERDFHPPVHAYSQAHERGSPDPQPRCPAPRVGMVAPSSLVRLAASLETREVSLEG